MEKEKLPINYKSTLNLPHTDFPMKGNLTHLEPNLLCYWQNRYIYRELRKARSGAKKFVLHDGPPYANGQIHIGHALNKILKDIVIKYKAMRGFDVPYVAGWDCHGLPVEHQLFKELKKTKHDVDIVDFRKKAGEFALKFVDLQRQDFEKMGLFSDWQNPYLTLNRDYEYAVIKLLQSLIDKGYIYRGRKPVNWCAACETALAEAEVEYADKQSDSIYVLFKTLDDRGLLGGDAFFLVWTTTPWTLISNVAVAVHPNMQYCLVEYAGRKVIVALDRLSSVEKKIGSALVQLKTFSGAELENIKLQHPFLNRESPVLLADFVSSEDGSGCVHIAPGHGAEDFSLTRKYPLQIIMPVDDKGIFQEPAQFKGMRVPQAGAEVIKILDASGLLLKHEKITHSYPHCWRCKEPIIFRATYQWFMNVEHDNLRHRLLDEIEKVNWVPSSGKERMRGMILTRPDWCLSRQRLWGIPIPAMKCRKCQEVVLDKTVAGRAADIFKQSGSDSWFIWSSKEFLPPGFVCPKCSHTEFDKEYDILDVWFESGASFFSVLMQNSDLQYPADLYLEGSDQHRGWFQVSLIPSVAIQGQAPFKTILTHGFVVDGEGRKMSKSLGNVIAPQEIVGKYGAEILRLWVAYSDYGEDVKISENIIKQLVDMYRKVRNTLRFLMGNLCDYDCHENKVDYDKLLEVDRYMLSRTTQFLGEIMDSYQTFSFYKVCQQLFSFCNLDLSSFYLDILKDRLYTFSPDSLERRSAQTVLYHIFQVLLKACAPILSFTAEEVYVVWESCLKDKKLSIFLTTMDEDYRREFIDEKLDRRWQGLLELRSEALKAIERLRESGAVGSSLDATVAIKLGSEQYREYKDCGETLRETLIVSRVTIEEARDRAVEVSRSPYSKCPRCWNLREDIGSDNKYPDVCSRCARALNDINFVKTT